MMTICPRLLSIYPVFVQDGIEQITVLVFLILLFSVVDESIGEADDSNSDIIGFSLSVRIAGEESHSVGDAPCS